MTEVVIRQTKSGIGEKAGARRTLEALGLRRMGATVSHEDSPVLRGMLRRVAHLVAVQEKG
ncbi:50S ribosomal protein L30 [soil metagenome]